MRIENSLLYSILEIDGLNYFSRLELYMMYCNMIRMKSRGSFFLENSLLCSILEMDGLNCFSRLELMTFLYNLGKKCIKSLLEHPVQLRGKNLALQFRY